ncbi:MAG: hypothetical protein KGD61_06260 [Candidatus Lokiarchaeota archaeon]|nr:hypothetical protein [Candidatus Lokiarchaeota archaeon]
MPTLNKNIRDENIQIYFDCICGTICSVTALIGIFIIAQQVGILYPTSFIISLSFMIGYLAISLFVIGWGIHTYYRAKNFNPEAIPKKKLRAPIV